MPFLCRVARESKDPDLDIPMNAAPKSDPAIPETLSKYFSLDKDFNPVGVNNILSSIIISVYDKHCLHNCRDHFMEKQRNMTRQKLKSRITSFRSSV